MLSMNRFILLLLFLFGGIECARQLSWQENQYWKARCGTKPSFSSKFGDRKRHIAGGTSLTGDRAPWAVRAGLATNPCSGTLISPRHVLSATHCLMRRMDTAPPAVKQSKIDCNGNDMILTQDNNFFAVYSSRQELLSNRVSRIILLNFCFKPTVDYDDFMIMELKEDVIPNEFVYPACVTGDDSFQRVGLPIRVTSFGHNNWDPTNKDGTGTYALRNGVFTILKPYLGGRGFLIDGKSITVATRPGDSGGSVIHHDNGRFYVIGAVNQGWDTTFQSGIASAVYHYPKICFYTGRCNQ